jgi:hypothetical protein
MRDGVTDVLAELVRGPQIRAKMARNESSTPAATAAPPAMNATTAL